MNEFNARVYALFKELNKDNENTIRNQLCALFQVHPRETLLLPLIGILIHYAMPETLEYVSELISLNENTLLLVENGKEIVTNPRAIQNVKWLIEHKVVTDTMLYYLGRKLYYYSNMYIGRAKEIFRTFAQHGVFFPLNALCDHILHVSEYLTKTQLARYMEQLFTLHIAENFFPLKDILTWLKQLHALYANELRAIFTENPQLTLLFLLSQSQYQKSSELIDLLLRMGMRIDALDEHGRTLGQCMDARYVVLKQKARKMRLKPDKVPQLRALLLAHARAPSVELVQQCYADARSLPTVGALESALRARGYLSVCGRFSRDSFQCILRHLWSDIWLACTPSLDVFRDRAILTLAKLYYLQDLRRYATQHDIPYAPKDTRMGLMRKIFAAQVSDVGAFRQDLQTRGQDTLDRYGALTSEWFVEQFKPLGKMSFRLHQHDANANLQILLLCRAFPVAQKPDAEPAAKRHKFSMNNL